MVPSGDIVDFEERNRRLSKKYEENPSATPYVVGGVVALGLLAWIFWPKKAEAKPAACASATDVKSFVAAKGLGVIVLDGVPSSSDVPPDGYDTFTNRVYSTVDCSFYGWYSLNGAKSTWNVDAPLNAEFVQWRSK